MFSNQFNFIDLCSGIGGFHSAINKIPNINSSLVFACDIDKKCREVYNLNYGKIPEKDLTKLDLDSLISNKKINGIFAGFPCQPFSFAGKRLGLDDIRGSIIYYILDMILKYKPDLICLENVKGIKSMKNKKAPVNDITEKLNITKSCNEVSIYEFINEYLFNNGYFVYDRVISPDEIGIPQKRERVVFVCIKKTLLPEYEKSDYISNFNQEIESLISKRNSENSNIKIFQDDNEVEERFKLKDHKKTSLELWEKFVSMKEWDSIDNKNLLHIYNEKLNKKIRKNFKQTHFFINFKDFKKSRVIPDNLRHLRTRDMSESYKKTCDIWNLLYDNNKSIKRLIDKFLKINREKIETLPFLSRYLEYSGGEDYSSTTTLNNKYAQFRQSGLRIRKGDIFPTLVKSGPRPIIISKQRYLTNVEMLKLQSFNSDFKYLSDISLMNQCGNAVNVEVIELMLQSGFNLINNEN